MIHATRRHLRSEIRSVLLSESLASEPARYLLGLGLDEAAVETFMDDLDRVGPVAATEFLIQAEAQYYPILRRKRETIEAVAAAHARP